MTQECCEAGANFTMHLCHISQCSSHECSYDSRLEAMIYSLSQI